MATREQIGAQYEADTREANAYKDTDPARSSELSIAAERRRADSLDEMSRASDLEGARARALVDFPDADPRAVTGANIEEIRKNAEESQTYIKGKIDGAVTASRNGSRAAVAQQWGPDGRPTLPRAEVVGGGGTADRTAATIEKEIREARERGDVTRVMALTREKGGMSGLDRMGEAAVARAREERGGGDRQPSQQEIEDRRG